MEQRKKIALLVGQPEENYQKQFIEGFFKQAFAYNYDVCVFAMYQKYQESEPREVGESNIFNLIQYDLFDAVVLLMDTIQTPGVAYSIEEKIKESYSGPVLCVDKESDCFTSVMMDHYTPIVKLITHLIEKHGYTDIAFLTGKQWHSHSKQRLDAFLDCMEAHGLQVGENRIFYGDYWYDSGANVVDSLLQDREHLPQAIACANDYMAIGVADELTKQGIRIPEDIKVIGYDSVEEGRTSPQPVTSIPVPSGQFGEYAVRCVKAMFVGEKLPEFKPDVSLFVGSSCGCHNESVVPKVQLRKTWATDISECSFYSSFNHLMEDMLSRTNFEGLMDTIQTYTYQIREFDCFCLCLNDSWIDKEHPVSTQIIRNGYAQRVLPVLQCGPSGKGEDKLNFVDTFDTKELFPALYKERDIPKAYFFTPLHFEDMCFGYAVLSYGNEPKCFDDTYYMWLRNVMMGMECYRRIEALRHTNEFVEESRITDTLTGLFNYKGFVKHAKPMLERAKSIHQFISILAVDVVGMENINANFGREAGDHVIASLAKMLRESAGEGGLCCRLGNDEFIAAQISEEANHDRIHGIRRQLKELVEQYNKDEAGDCKLEIATGTRTAQVANLTDMEHLVNAAVSRKNGNKTKALQRKIGKTLSEEELQEARMVGKILDENLFSYHFQPIVNAADGSIYAYEALMRAQVSPYVSPVQVIKYATHLERLYEVEKATFFNVLQCIDDNPSLFAGKKVFINSIPGNQLSGQDGRQIAEKMKQHSNSIVVELTEQTEADDKTLAEMKESFRNLGVETAVDDYGTGYSNIVNLLRYMPDYVKIDRMLLSGIQDNPQKQHFVKDIIEFAHENNFKVLAEGVETPQELQTVIELGIDLIQGYYTARPNAEVLQAIPEEIAEEIRQYHVG